VQRGESVIWSICGAALLAASLGTAPLRAASERPDLTAALHRIICIEKKEPSPKTLWAAGVFDAQLDGRVIAAQGEITAQGAGAGLPYARALAAGRHHSGIAAGDCGDGRAFAASVPAAVPVSVVKDKICIQEELRQQCRGVAIDFAAASGGRGRHLSLVRNCLDTATLPAGLVAVTCLPQRPRWLGPMAVAYVPVKGGPTEAVPEGEALKGDGDRAKLFENWINTVRLKEHLTPFSFARGALAATADRLAVGASLDHDRNAIKSESQKLVKAQLQFVGENRVRGRTLQEAAWQLYHSARHRNLLLSAAGNQAALVLRAESDGVFILVVVAAKAPARLSRAEKTSPHKP